MKPLATLILSAACFGVTGASRASPLPPLPAGLSALQPANLLPGDPTTSFAFRDRSSAATPTAFSRVNEPGIGPVLRGANPNAGQKSAAAEVSWPNAAAVRKGDACLARFAIRVLVAPPGSTEGSLSFSFQNPGGSDEKGLQLELAPGREWSVFEIPFTVERDYAAGEAMASFSFGQRPQTFELAGLELLDFHHGITVPQLPCTRLTYSGREADAEWRSAALARIEKIRTAPMTLRVTDGGGRPVAGAKVELELIQPAFIFGTAVSAHLLAADTPSAERYRRSVRELFDSVTIDNALKWKGWELGPAARAETLRAIDWLGQNHLRLRGHNLVWPGWKFSPAGLKDRPDLAQRLPGLITDRIRSVMAATKGRVYGWDVLNEIVHERDYFRYIPETTAANWFKLARQLDPSAELFINDYDMLGNASSPAVIARYRRIIGKLRTAGAPIDGIGVQSHLDQKVRSPAQVLADLDLLAAEGLPVQITEFDLATADERLQADYTRDFLIACYSHPAVTGFTMWGFWADAHWRPVGAMLRSDWSEKPNAAVWRDLVLKQWRTHVATVTGATGALEVRGHLGLYHVTVTQGAVVNRQALTLTPAGATIAVRFP